VAAGGSARRYPSIDILRGLALVSMVSTHLTNFRQTAVLGRLLHSGRWIDGAFFFVALSGVVTGLVHRRVVERSGVRTSAVKLARRAGFLYAVHVGLALLVVFAYSEYRSRDILDTPTWVQAGGAWTTVGRILTFDLERNFNTILPLYVAFLLWAIAAIWLLRTGRWWAVVGVSFAVYLFGQEVNGLSFASDTFELAGWQLLFTGGLLVGWTWEHERIRVDPQRRRSVVAACIVTTSLLYVAARVAPGTVETVLPSAVAKNNGGWIAFVFAAVVLVTGYAFLERVRAIRIGEVVLRPVAMMGTKGLPGYVTMILTVVVLDFVPVIPRDDLSLIGVVALCTFAEYVAVRHWPVWRRAAIVSARALVVGTRVPAPRDGT
jgi:hypothetical protein